MSKLDAATRAKLSSLKSAMCCNTDAVNSMSEIVSTSLTQVSAQIDPLERTPVLLRPTGAGTINVVTYDISVFNAGLADGDFMGVTLSPGETINFSAGALNNTYPAGTFSYDATGTEFIIKYNS